MAEPFLGEIRMFAGNYVPEYWALCNGDLISIAQNTALYSLLGTLYGGNGRSDFGLPNLLDRVVVGAGRGPGLSYYREGNMGGYNGIPLDITNMPTHDHAVTQDTFDLEVSVSTESGDAHIPANGNHIAKSHAPSFQTDTEWFTESDQNLVDLGGVQAAGDVALHNTGEGQSHYNIQPSLAVYYIIALEGLYPTRP